MLRFNAIVVAALAAATGCDDYNDPNQPAPVLAVLLDTQQPQSSNLGIVVDIQTTGGNYLSLAADQGTLRVLTTDNGAGTTVSACIPIDNNGSIATTTLLALPTNAELVLFANLYSLPSYDATASDGICQTGEKPIASKIVALAHNVNNELGPVDASEPIDAPPDVDSAVESGDAGPPEMPEADTAPLDATDASTSSDASEGG
jgi:hypothetical protein